MDADDLALLQRSVRAATDQHTGDALDTALSELGWHDALAVAPAAAVSTLFALQGAANRTSSAVDAVMRTALGANAVGLVLPAIGQWCPPGELTGDVLAVRGLATAATTRQDAAIVTARSGDDAVAIAVPTAGLTVRAVHGLDPRLGIVEVTGDVASTGGDRVDWTGAVRLAQLAIGHELAGAATRMLELACAHARERVQFGQPISTFQAVRHRLADALVGIETTSAALDAAWRDGSPQAAAIAKALAGRGALLAARHCQQVLAGIGFTTEHPFHRYVRRVLVLDQLFGSARALTRELGAAILHTRRLPPLLPL
jgi:hypothetical protein